MNKLLNNQLLIIILCLCATTRLFAQQPGNSAGGIFKSAADSAASTSLPRMVGSAGGQTRTDTPRQLLANAWWTGPMLAPSAGTLPRGHFLVEPYVYDVTYPHTNSFGSLAYLLYGVANRFTAGMMPSIGYSKVSNGLGSSGIGLGDLTLLAQYRLNQFHEGSWVPIASVNLQETLPTGRYDKLGSRTANGFGSGAYTTTLSLYLQTYFWLKTGRILRMRLNFSQAFSGNANLVDVSVYGTGEGFRGHAKPGRLFSFDAAWEYSLTQNWVLALDVIWHHDTNTGVTGYDITYGRNVTLNTGFASEFGFAPAIEYNWKPTIGVLLGTRIIPEGHNVAGSVTPAVAVNMVF